MSDPDFKALAEYRAAIEAAIKSVRAIENMFMQIGKQSPNKDFGFFMIEIANGMHDTLHNASAEWYLKQIDEVSE